MTTRCYEDFCLPDNSSAPLEISSATAPLILGIVFWGVLAAVFFSNVDLSGLDFTGIVDNGFGFPF